MTKPWTYCTNEHFGAVAVIESGSKALVADLSETGESYEQRLRRARLISASPALLDAARATLEAVFLNFGEPASEERTTAALNELAAAVARAEGRDE